MFDDFLMNDQRTSKFCFEVPLFRLFMTISLIVPYFSLSLVYQLTTNSLSVEYRHMIEF